MRVSRKIFAATALATVAMVATVADARHSWRKYNWAHDGVNPINIPVVDNTTGQWPARVILAVADWDRSAWIVASKPSGGSNRNCNFDPGTIQVCNDDYGDSGWLGIASIEINGSQITAGITKLNDFYFVQPRYSSESWKQLVTCQEIGHDYGLGHQNENFNTDATTSCMEYTSWPDGNESPDQHDYDQLASIYGGGGGGGGGGGKPPRGKPGKGVNAGNSPAEWGRAVGFLPNGKPFKYERQLANGTRIITHVTWTIEAAAELGDHHGGGHKH